MTPKEYLDELYEKISTDESSDKGAYSYSIIQLKNKNSELTDYTQSIYQDTKKFLQCYILSTSKRDYGYDVIDVNKIIRAIYYSSIAEKQNALFIFAYRILKKNQFEEEAECIIPEIRKTKLRCIWTKTSWFSGIFKCLFHLMSYNITVVLSLLVILTMSFYIITFPNSECIHIFILTSPENYCCDEYCNHFINLTAYIFGLSDNFISPANWKGVILLSFMKLFYILFIANYLFKILMERLNLNK